MKSLLITAGVAALGACGGASVEPDVQDADAASSADDRAITGGFAAADPSADYVAPARQLAIDAVYEQRPTRALVDKVDVDVQVVAGLNYRFRIEMGGAPTARAIYVVTVYEDLSGNLEVTGFEQIQ